MAYGSGSIALTAATPVRIYRNPQRDHTSDVLVTNSGAAAILLGGANVSATVYGYSLAAGASQKVSVAPQDDLWAYSVAAGTALVLASP